MIKKLSHAAVPLNGSLHFFPVLVYDIELWNALLYSSMDTSRKNNVFYDTLIKKKIKFSSYIKKFEWSSCKVIYDWRRGKYLRISSYIRKPYLIYDFGTAPLWISLYMAKIWFSFLSVYTVSGVNGNYKFSWQKIKKLQYVFCLLVHLGGK